MKKLIFTLLISAAACFSAGAWGRVGHEVVIAIAQRHISDKTKANIAQYFDYDIRRDAVWMDQHRRDKCIAYTTAWHVYNVDENHNYDPNPRLHKGDVIHGLQIADYNLRHYKELSDSAVVMNVRMLIHFVGDMHCPVHSYLPGPRNFWECSLEGYNTTTFHALYDKIPEYLWPGKSVDEIVSEIDVCGACKRHRIAKGTLYDWARACGDRNAVIYEINPPLTKNLDPDTVEKSREVVTLQLRDAGYRLARLLEFYFGK